MAGLLAGNMLRRHDVKILERKPGLPDNHSALLRFRSTVVSAATGIPFERVRVRKGFWDGESLVNKPTLAHANLYSLAVTGEVHTRSITNMEPSDRYVAPADFIQQMAKHLDIAYGQVVDRPRLDHPVISTMPMPLMMDAIGWEDRPKFNFQPIWTITCQVDSPRIFVHQTLYSVEPGSWYRATLHGSRLTLEFAEEPHRSVPNRDWCSIAVACFFGHNFPDHKIKIEVSNSETAKQPFGKITPIPEDIRKKFILHLTDKWNIYSLGRFAT